MTRLLLCLGLSAMIGSTVVPAPALAQERERRSYSQDDREAMMERVRAHMARTIQERLDLDDASSAQLSEIIREFDGRRRTLARAEGRARRAVEALLEEAEPDEEVAARLMTEMATLQSRESELFAEEQAALLEILSPVQVLQLQDLREEMGRRIRSLRGRSDRGGRRGGEADDHRRRRRGGGGR